MLARKPKEKIKACKTISHAFPIFPFAINKLAATKASGIDKLPTKILKIAAPIFQSPK